MMTASEILSRAMTSTERRRLSRLNSPEKIQTFLDRLDYSGEDLYRCPLKVFRDRKGHCFDGAVFAAAALSFIGYPPLILDMIPNNRDDDHVLTLFKNNGHWGACAKSNFAGLRFREPIHRNLRELMLSYFESFFNIAREKTLRSYAGPLNLNTFDRFHWMTEDKTMGRIARRLDAIPKKRLLTQEMSAGLCPVDERSYRAGLLGADRAGLYRPPKNRFKKGKP